MSDSFCNGYIFNIRSLVVLQEHEVDRSSSGVQGKLRSRLGPQTEIHVTEYA